AVIGEPVIGIARLDACGVNRLCEGLGCGERRADGESNPTNECLWQSLHCTSSLFTPSRHGVARSHRLSTRFVTRTGLEFPRQAVCQRLRTHRMECDPCV